MDVKTLILAVESLLEAASLMKDVKRLQKATLDVLVGVHGVGMRVPQNMANVSVMLNLVKRKKKNRVCLTITSQTLVFPQEFGGVMFARLR